MTQRGHKPRSASGGKIPPQIGQCLSSADMPVYLQFVPNPNGILRKRTRPVTTRSKGQHLNQIANLVIDLPRMIHGLGDYGPQQLAIPLAQPVNRDLHRA